MEAYKVIYWDECETTQDMWKYIEIVERGHLVKFVEWLLRMEKIYTDNYKIFLEKHPDGVQTDQDAIELLRTDGWAVDEIIVQ